MPRRDIPQYAFIGRSNVGKSSLINMLTGRKGLAMTSATPGKTMLINHFLINKNWYIVDLPGYGYARRGQKGQEQIQRIIETYILQREQMTSLFVLVDSRHEPQAIDLSFIEWLGDDAVPFRHRFHQSRQAERRQDKQQYPPLSGESCTNNGQSFPLFRHILRKPNGPEELAELH